MIYPGDNTEHIVRVCIYSVIALSIYLHALSNSPDLISKLLHVCWTYTLWKHVRQYLLKWIPAEKNTTNNISSELCGYDGVILVRYKKEKETLIYPANENALTQIVQFS